MIEFNSRNIDGEVRKWKFNSKEDIEKEWKSPDADVPANDDPIWNVYIDGTQIVWKTNKKYTEDDPVWFEDLLTYLGIEIWG